MMRQETAALRDFDPADVRFGSSATGRYASGGRAMSALPQKRTSRDPLRKSALCQKQTYAAQQNPFLFDHLVGAGEQCWRDFDAEHHRCCQVDDKLELARLHDWDVSRLNPLEDATGVDADLAVGVHSIGSITHQPAGFDKVAHVIRRRNCV